MSRNCTTVEPHLRELLADLGTTGLGLVISTGVATLFVLGISICTVIKVHRNTVDSYERFLFYCLIALCPVVGVTSFIGIISPRSIHIDDLVAAIYLSLAVVIFFRLMMFYHGGEKALCERMNGEKLPFAKRPFCCCLCLRNIYLNRRTLKRLKVVVYQVVVARPMLLYLGAVIKSEETTASASLADNPIKALVSVLTTASTITALLALVATFRLSIKPLQCHGIVPKFLYLKLVMLFCDPQAIIVNVVVTAGGLPCGDLFYHPSRGDALKFVLLCFEMALVSILGFKQYGRSTEETQCAQKKGLENGNATMSKDYPENTVVDPKGEFTASSRL